MFTKYDKAIVALVAGAVLSYLTPEVVDQLREALTGYAAQAVAAAFSGIVGGLLVWATKNKQ